ncbi:hypothetical protein [Amycolatopsis sp.]|uniref:hypothetical protein n=1 Tax=Amycolatopsis sp. TaxID=37632 RepID=UPI002BE7F3F7|nr:hypothetical protein [Amycolatopsis sp.]HVV13526.1 hypothetical protein [Amycolatopsis sp.]
MNQPDELDDELTRLFTDERLAVPPRAGAETAILAGARRIRRRRAALTATGGALTAIALVGAGLLIGDLRSNDNQVASPPPDQTLVISDSSAQPTSIAPAPPPVSTPLPGSGSSPAHTTEDNPPQSATKSTTPPKSTSRSVVVPTLTGPVLGPNGYSKLQLGMSFDAAKATGMLANADNAPTACTDYGLSDGSAAVSKVTISPANGIVSFQASGAHTPERIKVGSTKDQLETAYPALAERGSAYSASTGSGGSYVFTVSGDQVVDLQLVGSSSC